MNSKFTPTRKFVAQLPPVIPAKSNEEIINTNRLNRLVALNSNENPLGVSPLALTAITEELESVNRYPDTSSTLLRNELATLWDLTPAQVILSNGCDNIITVVMSTFICEGDELIVGNPSFFMYGVSSGNFGAKIVKVPLKDFTFDLEGILAAITPKTKMIVICNPNNPTGTYVNRQEIQDFMEKVPKDILIIADEAYAEFVEAPDFPEGVDYIKEGRNLLVFRTFSKIYGLAGLRIGYALAPAALIGEMRKIIEYFPVNRLAATAARAALWDQDFVTETLNHTKECRAYFEEELSKLGFSYVPSSTNFMFVDAKLDTVQLGMELEKRGILIKPGVGWGYPTYFRFSFGTKEENQLLIKALREITGV